MKNLSVLILFFTQLIFSQTPQAVLEDLNNFKPGELIVKLKDNVDAGVTYAENGKAMSSFNIGELLGIEDKIESSSVMFHQKAIEASVLNSQKMKAVYLSKGMTNPKDPLTMKNIFVLKTLNVQENILMLIEEIKNNPNVEYAEPNYIYSIDDFEVGDIIYDETDGETEDQEESSETSSVTIEVDDPLYSSQTNITSTNIDDVWDQYTTGDGSQVIAILDTGGDYTHPDLEANTWINTEELNGVEGYDDDGNGYVDDIRGWDFINIDNAPLDDNVHGTHVAGIAGAVGNNGIGIAGAAWNVKLMHIKILQSTGQGSITTIAEGVEYAYTNGATIINMSFGSYAASYTLKIALENAYSTSILVSSAGNDGWFIGPEFTPSGVYIPTASYPAAYTYVIGIQENSTWSNRDQDGPIYSGYNDQLNYELSAPGTGIISTVPNGGYATLTGTSMSAPLVAGGLALYKQLKSEDSQELMFGNLINTASEYVDILAAIEVVPTPKLAVINKLYKDTINSQNGNDFWEPGETIEIFPIIKNFWGPTDDVRVGITFAEFEDTSKATITQNEIQIGSISAYASLQDLEETLKITLTNNIAHNVDIKFVLTAWSGPDQEYISEPIEIIITTTNAIIFNDYITEDLTLTNDTEWIFTNSMIISNGATLTIEAGTTVKMSENTKIIVDPNSRIFSNGTKENPVTITSYSNYWRGITIEMGSFGSSDYDYNFNYVFSEDGIPVNENTSWDYLVNHPNYQRAHFNYTIFKNFGYTTSGDYFFGGPALYQNCDFRDFDAGYHRFWSYGVFDKCSIRYGVTSGYMFGQANIFVPRNIGVLTRNMNISSIDNFGNLNSTADVDPGSYSGVIEFSNYSLDTDDYELAPYYAGAKEMHLYDINNQYGGSDGDASTPLNPNLGAATAESGIIDFPSNLWIGTNSESIISPKFWTYTNSINFLGLLNYDTRPAAPFENNHATVWKVLVNGYDAQDEYALIDPVGVGSHEFKVYFNRAMDTSIDPQISYGVRLPYTQKIITEEGTWSDDGKIYTVTHDIRVGAADGINRIRVTNARDLDLFEITRDNMRFNFLLQSAGSASAGWYATAGLGNIALTWEAPDANEIDDALGYNMYRYEVDADGVESTPVKLNETLIVEDTDESTTGVYYTDFNVTEGETYFYKYNILRTSFEVTDYSSVVSTTPLTSTLGDSNGDFSVNVQDLVHDVDYILGNNPTPFIFLAGDVNADLAINVLDIVATVDIILNPSDLTDSSIGSTDIQFYPSNSIGNATFSWEGNDLYVESDHNIGGLQLAFSNDFEYTVSSELATIEKLDYIQDDNKIVMLFSFNNTVISSGKTKLLTRLDETKDLNIDLAVVGTTSGSKLTAIFEDTNLEDIESPFQSDSLEFLSMIPNPTSGMVNLKYYLPEQMDGVVAKVYDIQGRLVWSQRLENMEGAFETQMNLNKLQTGNYIVLISGNKNGGLKTLAHKMLIVK